MKIENWKINEPTQGHLEQTGELEKPVLCTSGTSSSILISQDAIECSVGVIMSCIVLFCTLFFLFRHEREGRRVFKAPLWAKMRSFTGFTGQTGAGFGYDRSSLVLQEQTKCFLSAKMKQKYLFTLSSLIKSLVNSLKYRLLSLHTPAHMLLLPGAELH